MPKAITSFVLSLGLMASAVSAQTDPAINIFFGFDYVLQPIAIKWACGGQQSEDLTAIEALIAAFPEDAERADLRGFVDSMLQVSERRAGLTEILGAELTSKQTEQLCAAARPLSLVWATPEQLTNGGEDTIAPEPSAAWAEFYRVVEHLQ
ncbi:hypothetical protein [Ruegeria arenilitoris]|uniref:hypothetical protein n=1 Tax=Ruegeria arenilitoris TaxID=1173585 RepID=UPI0014818A42|nr:hypothetical protein [Ruegeria arenilitoris]